MDKLLTDKEVLARVRFSRSSLYRDERAGKFPPSVGRKKQKRWRQSDVDAYIASDCVWPPTVRPAPQDHLSEEAPALRASSGKRLEVDLTIVSHRLGCVVQLSGEDSKTVKAIAEWFDERLCKNLPGCIVGVDRDELIIMFPRAAGYKVDDVRRVLEPDKPARANGRAAV